jgi:hypothetical protein
MSATITANNGAGSTTPHFITLPYETGHQSRSVVHDLLGGGLAVSLVTPRPRSGELQLLYVDEATANAGRLLHLQETTFTLTETSRATVNMTYVVDGEVRVTLDTDGHAWVVSIGYQEVTRER